MPLYFSDVVGAGVSKTLEYTFNFPCSIERMDITFPIGSNGELQIYPYLEAPDSAIYDLVEFVGSKYIIGDNQVKPYSLARAVELGWKFKVSLNNTGTVSHGFVLDAALDLLYGPVRIDAGKAVGAHV